MSVKLAQAALDRVRLGQSPVALTGVRGQGREVEFAQPSVQSEYVRRVSRAAWVARVLDRGQFAALGAMGGFHAGDHTAGPPRGNRPLDRLASAVTPTCSTSAVLLSDFGCTPATCPGDIDGDGDTDLADLGILLADFGCRPPATCVGDLTGDGITGLDDLGILLADFGCAP